MKKNTKTTGLVIMAIICGMALGSCKKSSTDLAYFKTYVNTGEASDSLLSTGFIFVGDSAYGNSHLTISAGIIVTTREAPENVTVKLVADTTLVSAYNQQNGTHYQTLPAGNYTMTGNGTFTIKQGDVTSSDSVGITFVHPEQLTNANGYLVPLVIRDVNGTISNVISTNRNALYVRVSSVKATLQLLAGNGSAAGQLTVNYNNTPLGLSYPADSATFMLQTSVNVPGNINFSIEARNSLVDSFNAKNSTAYLPMPAGSYTLLNNGAATISAGSNTSGNFQVNFDTTKLTDTKNGYLLPVGLKGFDNSPANMMYVIVVPVYTNIDPSNSAVTGTAITRTAWTASATAEDNDQYYFGTGNHPASYVLDGDYTTSWDSDDPYDGGGTSLPQSLTIDMGSSHTLKGMTYAPDYTFFDIYAIYGYYYDGAPTQMTVYSSTDGSTWVSQGIYNGASTNSSSTASSPQINNIKFYSPVTARYFKFTVTSSYGGNYVGLSEVNGVE